MEKGESRQGYGSLVQEEKSGEEMWCVKEYAASSDEFSFSEKEEDAVVHETKQDIDDTDGGDANVFFWMPLTS